MVDCPERIDISLSYGICAWAKNERNINVPKIKSSQTNFDQLIVSINQNLHIDIGFVKKTNKKKCILFFLFRAMCSICCRSELKLAVAEQDDWCTSVGRVYRGVGRQRPLRFPHVGHFGSDPSVHRQRAAVLETGQDDRGTWPRAKEEAEASGKHKQGQEEERLSVPKERR